MRVVEDVAIEVGTRSGLVRKGGGKMVEPFVEVGRVECGHGVGLLDRGGGGGAAIRSGGGCFGHVLRTHLVTPTAATDEEVDTTERLLCRCHSLATASDC